MKFLKGAEYPRDEILRNILYILPGEGGEYPKRQISYHIGKSANSDNPENQKTKFQTRKR